MHPTTSFSTLLPFSSLRSAFQCYSVTTSSSHMIIHIKLCLEMLLPHPHTHSSAHPQPCSAKPVHMLPLISATLNETDLKTAAIAKSSFKVYIYIYFKTQKQQDILLILILSSDHICLKIKVVPTTAPTKNDLVL